MTSKAGLSLFLLIIGSGACATVAQPLNAEDAAAAIRSAEEVGAAELEASALPLQLAKEQLDHARTMTAKEQRPAATRMLMRSQADAELALALARASQARGKADKAKGEVEKIEGTAN